MLKLKKVAFFHGLESLHYSEKNQILEQTFETVYAPPMDYHDTDVFQKVLNYIEKDRPDILIGSSMGGWFAYALSTHTGIPTLLFNPAVHSRPRSFDLPLGAETSTHIIVLGNNDDVIDPKKTINWFKENCKGDTLFDHEDIEHRIPKEVFQKCIDSYC